MQFLLIVLLLFIFLINTCIIKADTFAEFEQLMLSSKGDYAGERLKEDFKEDKLKEIEIICPGDVSPIVKIRDLVDSFDNGLDSKEECMVIKMTGSNFNFKLTLNCNEAASAEFDLEDYVSDTFDTHNI
jgi:hypothetical protein